MACTTSPILSLKESFSFRLLRVFKETMASHVLDSQPMKCTSPPWWWWRKQWCVAFVCCCCLEFEFWIWSAGKAEESDVTIVIDWCLALSPKPTTLGVERGNQRLDPHQRKFIKISSCSKFSDFSKMLCILSFCAKILHSFPNPLYAELQTFCCQL